MAKLQRWLTCLLWAPFKAPRGGRFIRATAKVQHQTQEDDQSSGSSSQGCFIVVSLLWIWASHMEILTADCCGSLWSNVHRCTGLRNFPCQSRMDILHVFKGDTLGFFFYNVIQSPRVFVKWFRANIFLVFFMQSVWSVIILSVGPHGWFFWLFIFAVWLKRKISSWQCMTVLL